MEVFTLGMIDLTVSAFTSDPETADDISQNSNGLGTVAGPNTLDNQDPNFFGQFLSFGLNVGTIESVVFHQFGRREEIQLIASDTNDVPAFGQFDVLALESGAPGKSDHHRCTVLYAGFSPRVVDNGRR